jgi:hypothetical protein
MSDGCYHYHADINCTQVGAAAAADPDTCLMIGYMLDGYPVYGFCEDSAGMQMTSCYSLNPEARTTSVETAGGTFHDIGHVESDSYNNQVTFKAKQLVRAVAC